MAEFLPIPTFGMVREVIHSRLWECTILIAPDHAAGAPVRYSVIRIMTKTGATRCIGRELPLHLARRVACRPPELDGKPL